MSVKVKRVDEDRMLRMLADPHADFLSLVEHGANRRPFKVVKSDGTNRLVMHSVLLPANTSADQFAADAAVPWAADIRKDRVVDRGAYTELVQVPVEKFDPESLRYKRVGKSDAIAVVGRLIQKADIPSTIPAGSIVYPADSPTEQLSELFSDQLSALLMSIAGAVGQTAAGHDDRLNTITTALQNFSTFVTMGLGAAADDYPTTNDATAFVDTLARLAAVLRSDYLPGSRQPVEPDGRSAAFVLPEDVHLTGSGEETVLKSDSHNHLTQNGDQHMCDVKPQASDSTQVIAKADTAPADASPSPDVSAEEIRRIAQAAAEAVVANMSSAPVAKTSDEPAGEEGEDPFSTLLARLDRIEKSLDRLSAVEERVAKMADGMVVRPRSVSEVPKTQVEDQQAEQRKKWDDYPNGVPREHRTGVFRGLIFADQ